MRRLVIIIIVATTVYTTAIPQQAALEKNIETDSPEVTAKDTKPLETDRWKELLAQGRLGEMVESLQRFLGSKTPVQARTQWGNEFKDKDEVRNTVKWSAWKGDKSNLNLIVDSKVAQRHGKIDFMGPNFGLSYQLKY